MQNSGQIVWPSYRKLGPTNWPLLTCPRWPYERNRVPFVNALIVLQTENKVFELSQKINVLLKKSCQVPIGKTFIYTTLWRVFIFITIYLLLFLPRIILLVLTCAATCVMHGSDLLMYNLYNRLNLLFICVQISNFYFEKAFLHQTQLQDT